MVQNVTMDGQEVVGPTIDSELLQRHGMLWFHMTGEEQDAGMEAKLQTIHITPTSKLQSLQDIQHVGPSWMDTVEALNKTVQTLKKQLYYYKSLSVSTERRSGSTLAAVSSSQERISDGVLLVLLAGLLLLLLALILYSRSEAYHEIIDTIEYREEVAAGGDEEDVSINSHRQSSNSYIESSVRQPASNSYAKHLMRSWYWCVHQSLSSIAYYMWCRTSTNGATGGDSKGPQQQYKYSAQKGRRKGVGRATTKKPATHTV